MGKTDLDNKFYFAHFCIILCKKLTVCASKCQFDQHDGCCAEVIDHSSGSLQPVSGSGALVATCYMLQLVGCQHFSTVSSSVMFSLNSNDMCGKIALRCAQEMLGEEKVELWISWLNECSFQYCEAATRSLDI